MKLNLGCGNDIQKGYINHDLVKHRKEVDIIFDLNEEDWGELSRDGVILFFNEIRAWDVIEHLNNSISFMDNCWKLLEKDGVLDIKACGWQNPNFNVDITHKGHGFDIKSFDYFDPDTELGKEYGYYTNKKWKILEKKLDRRQNILIKLTPIK